MNVYLVFRRNELQNVFATADIARDWINLNYPDNAQEFTISGWAVGTEAYQLWIS